MLDVDCPKLGEMDLMGTKVDNAVILSIIAKAPLLWHLSLCNTPHITISNRSHLKLGCACVEFLATNGYMRIREPAQPTTLWRLHQQHSCTPRKMSSSTAFGNLASC